MAPADLALLEANQWFGGLPADRRGLLLSLAQPRSVSGGTRLYSTGDAPDGLWAVLEGQVRLMAYPAPGLELLALLLGPGSWFGELSTLDEGPRPHDAITFGPTRLLHVRMATFARAAARAPELYRDIALLGCAHQRASLAFIAGTIAQPLPVRLARVLGAAARNGGSDSIALRQSDIAGLVGVSRQTLSKALQQLERRGVLRLDYARLTILDRPALAAAAAGE